MGLLKKRASLPFSPGVWVAKKGGVQRGGTVIQHTGARNSRNANETKRSSHFRREKTALCMM